MSPITRILAPVDFSESSVRAARAAAAWAGRFNAELVLLHVAPEAMGARAYDDLARFSPPTLAEDWTRGSRDALDALAARFSGAARLRTTVRVGPAASGIIDCAAELPADLIVMASRGHGPVGRALLGSVAEQVIRGASCPVLTIPGEVNVAHWNDDHQGVLKTMVLRTVVALTDFSEISEEALKLAHDLAAPLVATLHVLHVVPPGETPLALVPPPVEHAEELRWRAERSLMRATESFADARTIVTAALLAKPSDGAIAYADEVSADLIVLATHGRGALDRLLLGSVAQHVLRHAHCPVLTVNQQWQAAISAAVASASAAP
jgi:nucleotide-binding universal stress UspA family protein